MAIFRNSKKSESLLRFWLKFNQVNVLLTAKNQSKLVNSDWIDVGKCFAKLSSSEIISTILTYFQNYKK